MTPTRIILHHSLTQDSGTVSWGAIRRYHTTQNGWKDIGYHFGIELVWEHYEVLMGRMFNEVGAHTAGQNNNSVGICFVGNFDLASPAPALWKVGVKLVKSLTNVFGIPASEIHAHNEYAQKSCTGKMFDMKRFVLDVLKTGI